MERADTATATNIDTSFRLERVDAFHLAATTQTYWRDFRARNRASGDRFMLKPGWRTAYSHHIESAILKVTLSDGTIGWGEVTEPICPEVICRIATEFIAPLAGQSTFETPAALWDFAYDMNRCRGHVAGYQCLAMGALDVAVWDALSRRARQPLAHLIGAQPHPAVRVYMSGVRRATRAERAETLQMAFDEGLEAAKLFIDADLDEALREIEAMQAATQGRCDLMTDALWSFDTVAQARNASRKLGAAGIKWLECPLVPEDLDGHLELRQQPGTPIALGEHFHTHHQSLPWLRSGALEVFQPDISRTGISVGIRNWRAAEKYRIALTPHMGLGSPLVQAIALHFWAGTRASLPCEYQSTLSSLLPDVFDSGWTYDGGRLAIPDRPGLGVEIDSAALERHCPRIETWSAS